jgi:hypothetical protein
LSSPFAVIFRYFPILFRYFSVFLRYGGELFALQKTDLQETDDGYFLYL